MMGDGCIDLRHLCEIVDAAGFDGWQEVEILSARNWWQRDPDEVVEVVKPKACRITAHQKIRGGITIDAVAEYGDIELLD